MVASTFLYLNLSVCEFEFEKDIIYNSHSALIEKVTTVAGRVGFFLRNPRIRLFGLFLILRYVCLCHYLYICIYMFGGLCYHLCVCIFVLVS